MSGTTSPYRWLYRLGSGSSGVVWACEREDRQMAVKILRAGHTAGHTEAILRETRIGPLIAEHPGVVAVRHVEDVDGVLHLEMDQVRGPSLAQVVQGRIEQQRGGLPASVAVPWTIEVLEALSWVGRRVAPQRAGSFCHRDIKPANLLLDPSGRVRITDFGIARAEAELGFQTTQTGIVKGSPRYMAPEMILEKAPDARADQFSVGAVLFELLTGGPLYVGRDVAEVLMLAVQADVERRLKLIRGPADLVGVLRRMLARDCDDRFPHHDAAAAALRDLGLTGPRAVDMLGELLSYGTGPSDDLLIDGDEVTGETTAPVFELEASMQTDPGLVPQSAATFNFLGPAGATEQGSLHRPSLATFVPLDADVPTRPAQFDFEFDEVDAFGEPDATTDLEGVRPEPTPALRKPLSPFGSVAVAPPPGGRAPRLFGHHDEDGPTQLMKVVRLEDQLAALERADASEAPTAVLPDSHLHLELARMEAAERARAAAARRPRGWGTAESWLIVFALLFVLLGAAGVGLVVILALWWNAG